MITAADPVAEMQAKVRALARRRNALILAHNYQGMEVQAVADRLGDSYALAACAQEADADWIVFCGVRFMAETAKLLNPAKRVVLPEPMAGCDLAASISAAALRDLKARHPGARVVMYINSSLDVKAESDAICTSSNALKVVEAMDADEVIFGPDKNLARFVAARTRKRVIPWNGYCPIHERMSLPVMEETLARHPEAYVIVHPECPPEVQALADAILSTSQMADRVASVDSGSFVIGTEIGLIDQLRRRFPERRFWPAYEHTSCDASCACPYMKMTKIESVLRALETGEEEIRIDPAVAPRALAAVRRMLEIGK